MAPKVLCPNWAVQKCYEDVNRVIVVEMCMCIFKTDGTLAALILNKLTESDVLFRTRRLIRFQFGTI